MKRKHLMVISVFVIGLIILANMFWSAHKARKTSDKILDDFNKVDNSLQQVNDSINKAHDSLSLKIQGKLSE